MESGESSPHNLELEQEGSVVVSVTWVAMFKYAGGQTFSWSYTSQSQNYAKAQVKD